MRRFNSLALCLVVLAAPSAVVAQPTDHPFALVNVMDTFDLFTLDPNVVDTGFSTSNPPPNWGLYTASPRLGNGPSTIAVDGNRLWIGGFWDGPSFSGGNAEAGWYASFGIADIDGITLISGFDAPYNRYLDSFIIGPTVNNTDNVSGIDYDPINQRLYAIFDDTNDIPFFSYPTGAPPQAGAIIAAFDADPNSAGYTSEIWSIEDPFFPASSQFDSGDDRLRGGIAVDPFTGQTLLIGRPTADAVNDRERSFFFVDAFNPVIDPNDLSLFLNPKDIDIDANECSATFYRQLAFDAVTGDMVLRNHNAIERIARDPGSIGGRFEKIARFIEEPKTGGDGFANTTAAATDEQLVAVGQPVNPGDNVVGPGADGVLDTLPAIDDAFATDQFVMERTVGNFFDPNFTATPCDDDPNGYPGGIVQGQGVAVISSSNIDGLDVDLVIGNSRPRSGDGLIKDIRFHTIDGDFVTQLELPCTPPPVDPNGGASGIAIYDFDYDEKSGTLVVSQYEEQKIYVFKLVGPDPSNPNIAYDRYEFERDGVFDMLDFEAFQRLFTGLENTEGLGLAEQRLNTDSDCDLDFDDYLRIEAFWD